MTPTRLFPVLWAIIAVLLVSTTVTAQTEGNASRMRFLHAVFEQEPLDVYLAGNLIFKGVPYRAATPYRQMPQGNQFVRVVVAGTGLDGRVIQEPQINFLPNEDVTLIFAGRGDSAQAWRVVDDNSLPEPGVVRLRFLNASPDTPPLDVCVSGTDQCWFQNVPYINNEFRYVRLNPGTYSIDIRESNTNTIFRSAPGLKFDPGNVYSIYAVGLIRDNEVGLQVVTSLDAGTLAGPSLPPPAEQPPAPAPVEPPVQSPPPALPPQTGALLAPAVWAGLMIGGVALAGGAIWFVRRRLVGS